jgi:hypothetical protein
LNFLGLFHLGLCLSKVNLILFLTVITLVWFAFSNTVASIDPEGTAGNATAPIGPEGIVPGNATAPIGPEGIVPGNATAPIGPEGIVPGNATGSVMPSNGIINSAANEKKN